MGDGGLAGIGVRGRERPCAGAFLPEVDLSVSVAGIVGDDPTHDAVARALQVEVAGAGGIGGDRPTQRELSGIGLHARLITADDDRHRAGQRVVPADIANAIGAAWVVALRERDWVRNVDVAGEFKPRGGSGCVAGAGDDDRAASGHPHAESQHALRDIECAVVGYCSVM